MSTDSQILANQLNSQLSTGPKTEESKAISSQNRRTHGLTYNGANFKVLASESQEDFDNLFADLSGEHKPETPTESLLVQSMAEHQWLRDRAARLTETCFDWSSGEVSRSVAFTLYMRYQTMHERAFYKALNELLRLRTQTRKQEIGFERQRRSEQVASLRHSIEEMDLQDQKTEKEAQRVDKIFVKQMFSRSKYPKTA